MFRTIIALLFSLPYLLGAKTVLEDLETELKNIVQKVSPSIVVVESQKDNQGVKYAATGFVFDDNGDIVTLTDPSSDAKTFNVVFPNGKKYEAKLFNSDDATNLAVLKLKDGKGTPVSLGSSKNESAGSWGIILTSSYGTPSIALGIISGQRDDGMLQISAPINPGGSGGVVVDPQAKVIGIVTGAVTSGKQVRIKTKEGEYAVMTDYDIMKEPTNTILAMPTDEATDIIQKLIAGEKIEHGYLGVQLSNAEKEQGALVVEVNKGTPSEKAGIKKDDIIVKIDGTPVTGYRNAVKYVMDKKPGESITIIVSRKGEEKEIKVKLASRPQAKKTKEILKIINPELSLLDNEELLKGTDQEKKLQELYEKSAQALLTQTKGAFLGVYLQDIGEQLAESFGVETGVLIIGIVDGSSAKEAGLKAGDVIIGLDGKEVEDAAALRKILANKEPGDKLMVKFVRNKETKTLEVKLGKRKVKTELKRSEDDSPKIETEEHS
jgi:serine protease Do